MKHWRKTSGVQIGRVVSSFSFLLLVAIVWAGPFGKLSDQLAKASSQGEKLKILKGSPISDARLEALTNRAVVRGHGDATAASKEISDAEDYVQLMAIAEDASSPGDQGKIARRIKESGSYPDQSNSESSNWLSGAVERLKNLAPKERKRSDESGIALPGFGALGFIVPVVWFLLAAALLAFIIFALRFVSFKRSKKRKAKAVLEEDEPERTLDEWLALAEAHEREGRFREAVRALYLACLLKFDERNVARFIRAQTNWEHLARIEASPRLPQGLKFRSATQAFDNVWYGHKVRGAVDVDEFRAWYRQVTDALKAAAA